MRELLLSSRELQRTALHYGIILFFLPQRLPNGNQFTKSKRFSMHDGLSVNSRTLPAFNSPYNISLHQRRPDNQLLPAATYSASESQHADYTMPRRKIHILLPQSVPKIRTFVRFSVSNIFNYDSILPVLFYAFFAIFRVFYQKKPLLPLQFFFERVIIGL